MNVLDIIKKNRGEQHATMLEAHGREVAKIESGDNFTAIQRQRSDNQLTGPGRGLFQYEVSENTLGGVKGSGAAKTALTRYKQFYKNYKQEIPKQYQEELNRINNDNPDFSKLSRELQEEIFYADKERGTLPLDKLASGELSLQDAYVDYHWIGNKKSDQYESERKRVSDLYGKKIKPVEEKPIQQTMSTMEEQQAMMYQQAKKKASMQVATQFNILNVMEDLGQVFQQFKKEGE